MIDAEPDISVILASDAPWDDVSAVFGTRGTAALCRCQRYKLDRGESFGSVPAEERADRLRLQTGCDEPSATSSSGLIAYLSGAPAGWCAVEPRTAYRGLIRTGRVPWVCRDEDPADPGVWAITCLLARAGLRRRGVSPALARAAVEHAHASGADADAVEAYPMTTGAALPKNSTSAWHTSSPPPGSSR